MKAEDAEQLLAQPGSLFETVDWSNGERRGKRWKNGPQTLADIFAATHAHGDKPFLSTNGCTTSYRAFRSASDRFVAVFRSLGIGKGDVVCLCLNHEPEWIAAFFALARLGAISAPVNPAADEGELFLLLEIAQPAAIVCDERTLRKLGASPSHGVGLRHILLSRSRTTQADSGAAAIVHLDEHIGEVGVWANLEPGAPLEIEDVLPDDAAVVFFTSGTTGRPKGVLLSQRCCAYSVFHAAYRNARRALVEEQGPALAAPEVLLLVLPLFHASGSCDALLPLMVRGGLVVTMPFWSPARACSLMREHGVTIAALVPSIAEQLLRHPDYAISKSTVKQIFYGGAPPSATLPAIITASGAAPGQNWGMTETGGAVVGHVGLEYNQRPQSCGRPAPILEMRVVDESGNVRSAGEAGELEVRGPQVMQGYWRDDALTREFVVDGWLKTGDIATLDDEGYCSIVDRSKDMIITAGENIYCAEIELALKAHPKIEDAAVLGMPHADVGEKPVAIVVVKEGMRPPSEMDVRIFVGATLSPAKIPTAIIYRSNELPRNAMGKIEKAKLRKEILTAS